MSKVCLCSAILPVWLWMRASAVGTCRFSPGRIIWQASRRLQDSRETTTSAHPSPLTAPIFYFRYIHIPPPWVDSSKGPPRKNRQTTLFFGLLRSMGNMASDGPKWGREDFFLLIQALPTFWAERIWILRIFTFSIFWIPNFWVSRSQNSGFPKNLDFPASKKSGFPGLQDEGPAAFCMCFSFLNQRDVFFANGSHNV